MIVDSSALAAIILGEAERTAFTAALIDAPKRAISAGTLIELTVVLSRKPGIDEADLDRLLSGFGIDIAPVTRAQADIGRAGYRRYGRGSGSRARLNFGDCFAYALAKESGEALLFKGDDFGHTDVKPAL